MFRGCMHWFGHHFRRNESHASSSLENWQVCASACHKARHQKACDLGFSAMGTPRKRRRIYRLTGVAVLERFFFLTKLKSSKDHFEQNLGTRVLRKILICDPRAANMSLFTGSISFGQHCSAQAKCASNLASDTSISPWRAKWRSVLMGSAFIISSTLIIGFLTGSPNAITPRPCV